MKNLKKFAPKAIALCLSLAWAPAFAAPQYTITDLGTLGGTFTFAHAINDKGQVTGESATSGYSQSRAFLWQNGVMSQIGSPDTNNSGGHAINDLGHVIGNDTKRGLHGFSSINGVTSVIGSYGTSARGVNNAGTIVGKRDIFDPYRTRAFSYSGGVMTNIGTLGGDDSEANAISESGDIVGQADTLGNLGRHAFLYRNGTMTDLGVLGGSESTAFAVNSSGMVVGESQVTGRMYSDPYDREAFVYSNGVMRGLGTLGDSNPFGPSYSTARGLNDAGWIVGESAWHSMGGPLAMLYENGKMHNLNDLAIGTGWQLHRANDINNLGQIIGYGWHNGINSAFLLDPILVEEVVEPSSAGLIGIGALMLLASRKRRRRLSARD